MIYFRRVCVSRAAARHHVRGIRNNECLNLDALGQISEDYFIKQDPFNNRIPVDNLLELNFLGFQVYNGTDYFEN